MFESKIPQSNVVKNTAKTAISGKRLPAIFAALSAVFASYILYFFSNGMLFILGDDAWWIATIIAALASIFILSPLFLGIVRFFWRITADFDDGPSEIFYYFSFFKAYKRAIKLVLILLFRCGFIVLGCLLPFIIATLVSNTWIYQFLGTEIPLWAAGLELLKEFLKVSGIFLSFVFLLKYYLVPVVVVMDDDLLLLEAVHISAMVSKRSSGAFLSLIVSLIGWILLSFLGIPLIYTAPFIFCCYTTHCRYALVNYNLSIDFYNQEGYGGF